MEPRSTPHQLTADEVARLKAYDAQLTDVKRSIDQLAKAGIDVSTLQQRYDDIARLRTGMLTHLSPPAIRPRRTAG